MAENALKGLLSGAPAPKEEPAEGGAALAARDALLAAATEDEAREAFRLLKEACGSEGE